MKFTVTSSKPRNPLIAPTRFRLAGRHDAARNSQRQNAGRALRRELDQFARTPP